MTICYSNIKVKNFTQKFLHEKISIKIQNFLPCNKNLYEKLCYILIKKIICNYFDNST